MTTVLHICGPDGSSTCKVYVPDAAQVALAVGSKIASNLVASSKAGLELAGGTGDGNVAYTSVYGGCCANSARVAQQPGDTGAGHESRPVEVSASGMDVQVIFGTDADGGTQIPTAAEVVEAVNASLQNVVVAAAGGDGTGPVGSFALTNLAGGLDDGDRYKWNMTPPRVDVINLIETV